MSYRIMFMVNAVILAVLGALLILMPEFVLTQFKSEVYVISLFVVRFFGGALIMGGSLLWFLQDIPVKKQKIVAFILLASAIGGFILSLLGMTTLGVLRANGWILLVIFGLFALIYAYMLFLQPKQVEAKPRAPRKPKDTGTQSMNSGQFN
jgi:MFS family permease